MFISHSSGAWEARDQDGLMVGTLCELSTWLVHGHLLTMPSHVRRERERGREVGSVVSLCSSDLILRALPS